MERDFQYLKIVMNHLAITKKRALKAERLHKARIATLKKGVFTSYKPSVFKKRQSQSHEDVATYDT